VKDSRMTTHTNIFVSYHIDNINKNKINKNKSQKKEASCIYK